MSNGQPEPTPTPWGRVKPAWEATNPALPQNENDYRKLVENNLGVYVGTGQNGLPIYRRGDGTQVYDMGKVGPYARRQLRVGASGPGEVIDYPLADTFRDTDKVMANGNPWIPYGNTEKFDLSDRSIATRLRQAALAQRYTNTREPTITERSQVDDLLYTKNLYDSIAEDLAHLKDNEMGPGARATSAVWGLRGQDPTKVGAVSPYYTDLVNKLLAAQAAGIHVSGAATVGQQAGLPGQLPSVPLGSFIATHPIAGLALAGAGAAQAGAQSVYEFLQNQQNLTQLRSQLPQQQGQVNKQLFDTVKGTPNVRWAATDYERANQAATDGEKQFPHDDDPLKMGVVKSIPERQETPQEQHAETEATTGPLHKAVGAVLAPMGLDQPGNRRAVVGTIANLPSLAAGMLYPGAGSVVQKAADVLSGQPAPAPVGQGGQPTAQGTPSPTPTPAPVRQPAQPAAQATTPAPSPTPTATPQVSSGAAPSHPTLSDQADVDKLNPGDRFIWGPDGQAYVKH